MSEIFTPSDLATYMSGKATDDALVSQVTSSVNAWVENQTHRCWGEPKTVTERYDWGRNLWLRHQDVTAVASIKAGWPGQPQTTIDPTGYFFNVYGRVTMFWQALTNGSRSVFYNDYLEITYTYGVLVVPEDLKLAAMGIAAGFYNWAANGNKDVISSSVGSYRLEFIGKVRGSGNGQPSPASNTNEANFMVVKSYATQRM